jgi:uncharacterized membrane protein YdbT with pleckstrin-like domain
MFCIKCGAEFPPGAQFCAVCGEAANRVAALSPVQDEEKTILRRPAQNEEAEESIVFSIRPTLLFVKIGYLAAFIGAAMVAGGLLYLAEIMALPVLWWLAIPLGLLLLLIPAYYHFRRNMVRYTLTDSKLEIDTGFFSRNTQIVWLAKIQDVTISASFLQRIFGYGSLIVDNAGETAVPLVLKNINDPRQHANLLLREMRRIES